MYQTRPGRLESLRAVRSRSATHGEGWWENGGRPPTALTTSAGRRRGAAGRRTGLRDSLRNGAAGRAQIPARAGRCRRRGRRRRGVATDRTRPATAQGHLGFPRLGRNHRAQPRPGPPAPPQTSPSSSDSHRRPGAAGHAAARPGRRRDRGGVSTDAALALIASLPTGQAEAVLLRVVMGLDSNAAAAVLRKRPGAARVVAHRGLRRLADLLSQVPDAPVQRPVTCSALPTPKPMR
jgi:DNA-directed RNA polymerase specialized sigma24 family protein